ncbi:uncharacterized protein LOC142355706 isoform X1 [Convolutriloba macropyga]|uniref:uncharacterized protein LOC142355706 isoform X1 n=1 Tax=Convolutriloba macropyga TaxID=536237 RepID=UPI003F51E464
MQCSTDLSTLKPELEQLAMKHSEGEGKILELQSQVDLLHKELSLTNERERRKDQLIDLQRSKQERTEAELSSLRQINERQQKEIAVLERSLHSAQDLLGEIELNSVVVNSSSAQGAQNGVNGVNCDSPDKELGNVYGDEVDLLACEQTAADSCYPPLLVNNSSYLSNHSSSASGSLMTSSAITHQSHNTSSNPQYIQNSTIPPSTQNAHSHTSLRGSAGAQPVKKNVTFNSLRSTKIDLE